MPTHGIPAPVVAQYLRENRVVPEKNDLNSLLFLLTPGVESSKAGTLLSALVAFKRLHDDNALLDDVMPEFVASAPARYRGMRLRDLCAEMHAFYREAGCQPPAAAQFAPEHLPEMAMPPHEAVRQLCATMSTICRIDEIAGRIATTLFVVYPPGIATIVPGERLGRAGQADARLSEDVRAWRQSVSRLRGRDPGPLSRSRTRTASIRFYTYVVRE